MKAASYVLFVIAGICVSPILLSTLPSVFPFLVNESNFHYFYRPNLEVSYALYAAKFPESIVGTGGHLAWLTPLGMCLVYGLPALSCIALGLYLKFRVSRRENAAFAKEPKLPATADN